MIRTFACKSCGNHFNDARFPAPPLCRECELKGERDAARAECTEQREAKEAAYAELYKLRARCAEVESRILADEERCKLEGDVRHAESERFAAEQNLAAAKLAFANALEEEKAAKNSWYMRCRALEDDLETAGAVLGEVIVASTIRVGEKWAPKNADHAAVVVVQSLLHQRDEAEDALKETASRLHKALGKVCGERDGALTAVRDVQRAHDKTRAQIASLLVVRDAAKEYLMRSIADPNTGANAEDSLREALADIEMTEPES